MNIELQENERIDDLQINNLKLIQNKEEFCFGIDSVLLTDFSKAIKNNSTVLDLGTGNGIIAILLTAKIQAKKIIGVEIQEQIAQMAQRSVLLNKLEKTVEIINADIKENDKFIKKGLFDAIVTNPPYMKINSGCQNINVSKLISRHEVKCNLEDIAQISYKLLKDKGEIYMVHRPDRLVDILEIFRRYKLEIKEMRFVHSNINLQANLVLIKAIKNAKPFLKVDKPLYIYEENGKYTDDILKIYNKK